jgi:hypothetical protein
MENRINSDTDPLAVEDLREELDLKFEQLHIKDDNKSNSSNEEKALPIVQFKG